MYETIRIVNKLKPKYVIWENVKNLLSQKHRHNFDNYINQMEELGYSSYYQVLNSKDYGIPQNRERVFTISIRKDIDKDYKFPEKEELKLRLKDMLEDEVDEKYYLSDKAIEGLKFQETLSHKPNYIEDKDVVNTIDTKVGDGTHFSPYIRDWKDPKCVQVGNLQGGKWDKIHESCRRVYAEDGISPTIPTCQGGNTEPKVMRVGGIFDTEKSTHQAGSIYDKEGLAPTLDVMQGGWRQPSIITHNIVQKVKVRLYPVDVEALKTTLRNAKLNVDLNNKEIANILQIPQTQVEHYFRTDGSFAIPSPEIWLKLKELLKIETDYFDESIMIFEERDNEYDISNRVYDAEGIAPTQTIQSDTKILIKNATKQGYIEAEDGDSVNLTANDSMGVLTYSPYVNKKYKEFINDNGYIPELFNPYNKTEIKDIAPTLTAQGDSITKSGTVLKSEGIKVIGNYMPSNHDASRIVDNSGLAPTVKENHGTVTATNYGLRIRKLTPLECWRLQGFDDEDFYKAKERLNNVFYKGRDNSNSQLYKQAGNSITVNVLEKILYNLIKGE